MDVKALECVLQEDRSLQEWSNRCNMFVLNAEAQVVNENIPCPVTNASMRKVSDVPSFPIHREKGQM